MLRCTLGNSEDCASPEVTLAVLSRAIAPRCQATAVPLLHWVPLWFPRAWLPQVDTHQ